MRLESELACTAAFTPEKFDVFAKHLDPTWIDEALASTGVATLRRRRLPMEQAVWLVIGMALMRDRPIHDVVDHLDLALRAGTSRTVASSSVSAARARLGAAPVEWLLLRLGAQWGHESARRHKWRDLALYSADGSTLRVADSDENRDHFGGPSSTHRGESGYPQMRLVTLMALRSHIVVSAAFGPYAIDERTLAADLWHSVPENSVTILDRNYLQANVLVSLISGGTNRHWLTRAKKNSRWTVLKRLGKGDALVEIEVSSQARRKNPSLPKSFIARAIGYKHKGFEAQILLTSLLDARRYPADELRDLYHERWEIELGYGEIKTDLLQRSETIRSKNPEGVAQELWGILVAYNLIRREMEAIATAIKVKPTQISFVAATRYIVDEWGWSTITRSPGAIPRHLGDMRDKIRRFVLPPRRPERRYPRAVKIKMSNYLRKRPRIRP